jgi:hypothetical protein
MPITPLALADYARRNLGIGLPVSLMWQSMWTYQTIANNSWRHINAEVLVSRLDYTMRILAALWCRL